MIDIILQSKSNHFTNKEIVEIFSYDSDERKVFPYLHRYMNLVGKKLDEIEDDEKKLKRFALAGLFLTYRGCNHLGSPMETEKLDNQSSDIHTIRLKTFRDYFKAEIKSTDHYLKLINLSTFDYLLIVFRLKSLPRKLYKFVVK